MTGMDSPDSRELMQRVRVGLNAEAFLRTDLGGYVVERMTALRRDALTRLEEADPTIPSEVMAAQNDARVPLMVLQAISDAIEDGKLAEEDLTDPPE